MTTERSQQSSQEAHRIHELRSTHAVLQTNDDGDNIAVLMDIEAWRELARLTNGLIEQYKHLENELDDMTGQFCNEAIHLTRAEDRVRELEEQLEALRSDYEKVVADERAQGEEVERLQVFASSVRSALTACATGGMGEIEALETIQDALDTVPIAPYPAMCPDCGSGPTEEHGLGCPRGPSPMAGETLRAPMGGSESPSKSEAVSVPAGDVVEGSVTATLPPSGDECSDCGHEHVNGRSGSCSKFTCDCREWVAPVSFQDRDREERDPASTPDAQKGRQR